MKTINVVITSSIIVIGLSFNAYAWENGPMGPGAMPQGQMSQHEVHMNSTPAVHPVAPHPQAPAVHAVSRPVTHIQTYHNQQPVASPAKHEQPQHTVQAQRFDQYNDRDNDSSADWQYRRHSDRFIYTADIPVPVDASSTDEAPLVLGEIVSDIPTDYVLVPVNGVNYFYADGVWYLRVLQGFQVVQAPMTDQG